MERHIRIVWKRRNPTLSPHIEADQWQMQMTLNWHDLLPYESKDLESVGKRFLVKPN